VKANNAVLGSAWWKALRFSTLRMLLYLGWGQAIFMKAIDVRLEDRLAFIVARGDREQAPLLTNRQEIER
jgi:hypothetical protein